MEPVDLRGHCGEALAEQCDDLWREFGRTMLFDYQGLMVNNALGVHAIG